MRLTPELREFWAGVLSTALGIYYSTRWIIARARLESARARRAEAQVKAALGDLDETHPGIVGDALKFQRDRADALAARVEVLLRKVTALEYLLKSRDATIRSLQQRLSGTTGLMDELKRQYHELRQRLDRMERRHAEDHPATAPKETI